MPFEAPKKSSSLYPERPSAGLEADLTLLKKILTGEIPKINLSEKENAELLSFENELGEELEKIHSSLLPPTTFYLDYFASPEGKNELAKIFPENFDDMDASEIKLFLLKNRAKLQALPSQERSSLTGKTATFSDKKLLADLLQTYTIEGSINTEGIKISQKINILADPKKTLASLSELRLFRKNLKDLSAEASDENSLSQAKVEVLTLYKKRVNEMLAEQFPLLLCIKDIASSLGEENLTLEEKELLQISFGFFNSERNLSRYDKFLFGATDKKNESGMYQQVDKELLDYAQKIEKDYIENVLNRKKLVEDKGLDYEKINSPTISIEECTQIVNKTLSFYNLLSSSPPEDYNPDSKKPAPDNKWRFVAKPEYKLMSVNGEQKVIKSGIFNQSAVDVFGILCAHEIDGHAIQHENKSSIPFRLFKKIGAGRNQLFFEGGAMFNQDLVCQKLFGFRNIPHAHYIKSMVKKLEGGTYLDCIKTFFDSCQRITLMEKKNEQLTEEKFLSETKENLKLAINRTRRFFLAPTDLNASSAYLTKSKETVYIEQLLLLEKLKESGMEQLAFVGGANLPTLVSLSKLGVLDIDKIKRPSHPYLAEWEKVKDTYKK